MEKETFLSLLLLVAYCVHGNGSDMMIGLEVMCVTLSNGFSIILKFVCGEKHFQLSLCLAR